MASEQPPTSGSGDVKRRSLVAKKNCLVAALRRHSDVHELEQMECVDGYRFVITFEHNGIPAGFCEDYGLELLDAHATQIRPWWKLILGEHWTVVAEFRAPTETIRGIPDEKHGGLNGA